MADSKVPGVYYFEYPSGIVPAAPPFTTWSGLLITPPDSVYAERLQKKCGGVIMTGPLKRKMREQDGKLIKDSNNQETLLTIGGDGWISGFWTAPENWPEMAAGRESPTPFSTASK
uniref:Uncharacterized protein n=1 Tax=viral metagenome TaxID=1070528 RepID=A0A6C0E6L5_9ZZZZ